MSVAPTNVSNQHPRIALDGGGNPLVIWGRASDESVFISRWTGSAFSMPMKVSPDGFNIATTSWMGPQIAAKGDSVYVVMKRRPEVADTSHIFVARSFNGGQTFSPPIQADNIADSLSRFPTAAVSDQGELLIGFMKFDPGMGNARWVVTRSGDGGSTYSADVLASGWSGGTVCDCCPGTIVSAGNDVCMLYRDNLNNVRDMYAGISNDGGITFAQGMNVDQGNWMIMSCPASGPDGIILNDTLYSVFMSQASGSSLVYLSRSSVSTAQGGAGVPLIGTVSGVTQQNYPRIANYGAASAIVWRHLRGTMAELPLLFTNNLAAGFPANFDTIAMGGPNSVVNSDVAVGDGAVHVVWQDNVSNTVKYRKGTFSPFVGTPETAAQNPFELFPNPSGGTVIAVVAPEVFSPGLTISAFDISGRLVFNYEMPEFQEKVRIDAGTWASGIYVIRMQSAGHLISKRLLLQPEGK